jgi:hypothetical protein
MNNPVEQKTLAACQAAQTAEAIHAANPSPGTAAAAQRAGLLAGQLLNQLQTQMSIAARDQASQSFAPAGVPRRSQTEAGPSPTTN